MRKKVELWLDLRSPFSYLAKDPAYDLERDFEVELVLRPFGLNIAGAVNLSDPEAIARGMRKIKYLPLLRIEWVGQKVHTLNEL